VAGSRSLASVIRSLGLKIGGGTYDCIKRRIVELGLDTSHFRMIHHVHNYFSYLCWLWSVLGIINSYNIAFCMTQSYIKSVRLCFNASTDIINFNWNSKPGSNLLKFSAIVISNIKSLLSF
jgi:hypothetical protein